MDPEAGMFPNLRIPAREPPQANAKGMMSNDEHDDPPPQELLR